MMAAAPRPRRHQRSASFLDGPFAPLAVPRRSRKANFVVGGSSDEDDCPLVREVNQRARAEDHFRDFSYDAAAHASEAIPFPETPRTPREGSASSTGSSTPILLKNGRPLKPSLKARVSLSMSTPDVATMLAHAKSAPSTPRVHFPARERLESVVLFDKRASPLEVAAGDSPIASPRPYYASDDEHGSFPRLRNASFPFPAVPLQGLSAALLAKTKLKIALARSAPLHPVPRPAAHVHLAAVRLLATRLSGSILVKNISYNKRVVVRYTFDNWETTSEVTATWSSPNALADLPKADPKPFGDEETDLDVARGILVAVPTGYDRFVFNVKLDDVAPYLSARPMLLAVKFEAAGVGEWWDSCGGVNYRFEFDHVPRKDVPKEEPKITGRPRSNTSPAPLSTDATAADPPSASLLTAKLGALQGEKSEKTPERPTLKLQFPSDDTITPTPLDIGAPKLALVVPAHKPLTPPDSASSSPREIPAPLPQPSTQISTIGLPLPSPEDSPSSGRRQSSPLPSSSAVEAPAHSTTRVQDQSYADFIAKYCFAGAATTTPPPPAGPTNSFSPPAFGWGSTSHGSWGGVGFNYGSAFSGGDM
ncbi:Carbohydrate binding domain-containing protein [Ceratobasidium theobromae]|uniref:Carbohydrate binding domain-containing protein n=1 Tax=Ceratobasidium theobromae TaxID=1582974 RepID=A0A5N5QS50_9AGAM|nr:Carbohydrate binding domain-containing protein [Ceratobasidium theobromae]